MDEKDKKEKYIKFLYELKELPEAFTGLQVQFFLSLIYSSVGFPLRKYPALALVHLSSLMSLAKIFVWSPICAEIVHYDDPKNTFVPLFRFLSLSIIETVSLNVMLPLSFAAAVT